MNLNQLMRAVDYASDCALEAIDDEAAHQESIKEYVSTRGKQIHEKRMSNVSQEDFIIALEIISTWPGTVDLIRGYTYATTTCALTVDNMDKLVGLRGCLHGAISSALLINSNDLALTEAEALYGDMASTERH